MLIRLQWDDGVSEHVTACKRGKILCIGGDGTTSGIPSLLKMVQM